MIVYVGIALVVLIGFASLAVEFGRVQIIKRQLIDAADAAARYAASGISSSTVLTNAQAVAAQNVVDGSPLTLAASDVEVGTWNDSGRTFTVGGASPNAVRVTACRRASRGNAVTLPLASVVGMNSVDVSASSIALANAGVPDVVGLTSIIVSGAGTRIQRIASETGLPSVAGNGTWTTSTGGQINGDAYYRGSAPSAMITGTSIAMGSNLVYPAATMPPATDIDYNLGAVSWSGSAWMFPGNYQLSTFTFSGGTVTLSGDVNIYCSGTATITGSAQFNTNNGQYKLRVYMTSSATFTHSGTGNQYISIYAPASTVRISSTGAITGSVIANSINMSGGGKICYTDLLPNLVAPTSGGVGVGGSGIVTVR